MKKIFVILFVALLSIPFCASAAEKNYLSAELNQAVPNARILAIGIIRGGLPAPGGLKTVQQEKFTTVVDLRTPEEGTAEEKQKVKSLGMVYVNIPMADRNVSPEQVESLRKVLDDKNSYPVLMHCQSGGRVDALWKEYKKTK